MGEENGYSFSVEQSKSLGHSVKDFICPDSFDFDKADMTYLKFGNKYARTLFLKDIASSLDDDAINTFLSVDKSLVFSFDIAPVQHDQAVKEVENIALGVDTNITNWQMKQNEKNNFSATPPHKFQKQKAETEEFQNELVSFDQRMMYAIFTVTITADSKKELDIATDALKALGNEKACQFGVLTFQQLDGLNTALPIGVRRIDSFRTFLTKPLAIFTPFNVQEINHKNGVFYGQNIKSNNIILIDRTELMNGNSFILAVSGGGKSFAAKNEIINYILATDNDVIIIDPEREYSPLVKAFGGEIVYLSNSSDCRINALDINKNYDGEGKQPIKAKIDFIMSLFEQIVGTEGLDSKDKSLIDRAANRLYDASRIVDNSGLAPTVKENHGTVTAVVIDDTYKGRDERQYDDCCPALRSGRSGFKVQTEPCIAASRGRNPDNPNDRTAGIELQQRLEIKADGTSNTLTTLQKDNLVVEPVALNNQRVRKLTPKECSRLMTFDDADYEKMKAAGISDSALYKEYGNSIVVKVLMAIFKELI